MSENENDFEENDGVDPFDDLDEGEQDDFAAEGDPFNFGGEEDFGAGEQVPEAPIPSPPEKKIAPRRQASAQAVPVKNKSIQSEAAHLATDLPVQVVAVMGKKNTTVGELLSLRKGDVVELNRFPNEAVDLVANGRLMAKCELVEIDGKLGIRIMKIY